MLLLVIPAAALVLLVRINWFAGVATSAIRLPIQWDSVAVWQWYLLWALTALYTSIGLIGLFFLRRAFAGFARGELFNLGNSKDLRRFAILLFVHALATPIHFALTSVLLSFHHPAGERMLAIFFGSNELTAVGAGLVLWVMSNLLVEGSKLQNENRLFV